MTFHSVDGGYVFSAEDKALINRHRAITKAVNDQFIQVGAIFLKMSSKNPFDTDGWMRTAYHDTDLQSWIDDEDKALHNVGFNLQQGWMDIDIDAEDPLFNQCIIAALNYNRIDTRFQFGRLSVGYPTHVLVQLGEEEAKLWDDIVSFEPKEFRIDGKRYHVQLRSMATNTNAQNVSRSAKQTVMPGSVYSHKSRANAHDVSVWYSNGSIATNVRNVAATTPRRVNFNEIVRSIAFGVVLYLVKDHWIEGNRQNIANKLSGWLSRVVTESQAMNNHEAISKDVFCPVDTDDIAESLITFIGEQMNDSEVHMRVRTYRDAREKLERNPDARIPGWPAMEAALGAPAVLALRTVLMPGGDVSILTQMSDRYLYDEADNRYIDRTRFLSNSGYIHLGDELERRHKGDHVRIGGKPVQAFKLYESSELRKRVGNRDMYPSLGAGGVFRITSMGDVLDDEDESDPSVLQVFNTWRGWPVRVPDVVNTTLLAELVERLDKVLGYLTRDNAEQIDWIKKWLAWTFQHPGDKQQIAWVVVGEQGVGKSWIANVFLKALMGGLWGSASPKVMEGDFNIGPFKDKMFVFIDEAKFHSEQGVDEIKKLIRNVDVPGMEKFQEARNYHIYARLMFASNRLDMNIGQANVKDRALFYTRAYDWQHRNETELQFRAWAETLKPFFTEFTELMLRRDVRAHFMHYFMTLPTDKYEIESIRLSSSTDNAIVLSNMGWPRRIAKAIIEEGRIFEDLDITFPFAMSDFNKKVGEISTEMGMRGVMGQRVFAEFSNAGLVETVVAGGQRKLRFKSKLGTLTEETSTAFGVELEPRFVFTEKDMGPNDCDGSTRPAWKGNKMGVVAASKI